MKIRNYNATKLIDKGSYSKIYKGYNILTNEKVAIKIIDIDTIISTNKLKKIDYEMIILKKLSNNNNKGSKYIVKYIDDFIFKIGLFKYKILVMEYLKSWINLDEYIKKLIKIDICYQIESDVLKKIIINILKGLEYIHSNNISHSDIKPSNIMINIYNYNIKFVDFGLSYSSYYDEYKGTPIYFPPEIPLIKKQDLNIETDIDFEKPGSYIKEKKKHDIWAIGVVIYQLANLSKYPNNFPFYFSDSLSFKEFILSLKADPYKYPSNYTYKYGYNGCDFNVLIEKILISDPKSRPDINEIKIH